MPMPHWSSVQCPAEQSSCRTVQVKAGVKKSWGQEEKRASAHLQCAWREMGGKDRTCVVCFFPLLWISDPS